MSKDIEKTISDLRKTFYSGKTKTYDFRRAQLNGLLQFVTENERQILDILSKENRKPKFESCISEISHMKTEINEALTNLKSWMQPTKPRKHISYILDK
ncbi:hypothetical protein GWI33_009410, partial [Rhynchophorus ferrugineus]